MPPVKRIAGAVAVGVIGAIAIGSGVACRGGANPSKSGPEGVGGSRDAEVVKDSAVLGNDAVSDAGVDSTDGPPHAPIGDAMTLGCGPKLYPEGIPTSWTENDDVDCACRVYYSLHGVDIAPFEWVPCSSDGYPTDASSVACRVLKPTKYAPPMEQAGSIAVDNRDPYAPRLFVTRSITLGTSRVSSVVAGAPDGPSEMAVAVRGSSDGNCSVAAEYGMGAPLATGMLLNIIGNKGGTDPLVSQAVVRADGPADKLNILWKSGMFAANGVWGGFGPVYLYPSPGPTTYRLDESSGSLIPLKPKSQIGDLLDTPIPFDGGVFLQEFGPGRVRAVDIWTQVGGFSTFLHAVDPTQQAYGGFNTDGVDLVWEESKGQGDPPERSIYAAPFTTDVSALKPRRLRSSPSYFQNRFAVGCGYAAYHDEATPSHDGVFIVRLSDGVAWLVPSTQPGTPLKSQVNFLNTIAITCQDIFVVAAVGGPIATVYRFAIAGLGPGLPPD